jgi:hypothetical protein
MQSKSFQLDQLQAFTLHDWKVRFRSKLQYLILIRLFLTFGLKERKTAEIDDRSAKNPAEIRTGLHHRFRCKCRFSLHQPAHERTIEGTLHTQFFYTELRYVVLPFVHPEGWHVIYNGHKRRATCVLVP